MADQNLSLLEGSGPIVKFQLIKRYGAILKQNGFEPKTMSCEQLRSAIRSLLEVR